MSCSRKTICALALILFLSPALFAQSDLPLMGVGHTAASASSNIVFVESQACNNTSTHASYTCTLSTATGSGQVAVIVAEDYNAVPSAPTDGGDTFTSVFSIQSAHGNGYLDAWCGAVSSGKTSFTLNATSGSYNNGEVRIYSGTSASCPSDVVSASLLNTSATGTSSAIALSTQTDLGVAACMAGVTAPGFGAIDNWNNGLGSANASNAQDLYVTDIVNGILSQFTANMSNTHSSNEECAAITLQGAVAGTAPSGNSPTGYADFESGQSSGTALTAAILNSGSHGGLAGWVGATSTGNYNGFTTTSGSQMNTLHQVNVNGKTYAAGEGSLGIAYDMTTSPTNYIHWTLPITTLTALDAMAYLTIPSDTTDQQDWFELTAGSDDIMFDLNFSTGKLGVECPSGSTDTSISSSGATEYIASLQYVAGLKHTLQLYNSSGVLQATVSCAATGTNDPSGIYIGQAHTSAATGTLLVDNLHADWLPPATLTAAGNASGGNTAYTGTFDTTKFPANDYVAVWGFTNAGNNGSFKIVSVTGTTLTVANTGGVAETHAGSAKPMLVP
jgi:hypothetical protein